MPLPKQHRVVQQGKGTVVPKAAAGDSTAQGTGAHRPFVTCAPPSFPPDISGTPARPRSPSSSVPPGDQAEGTRPEGSLQSGPEPHKKPKAGWGFPDSSSSFGVNLPPRGTVPNVSLEVTLPARLMAAHF